MADPIIGVVQEVTNFSAVAVASISAVLPNVKARSILHVWATCDVASAITSIIDSRSQGYGAALNNLSIAGSRRLAQFRLENSKEGPLTVTANIAANSAAGIWVVEIEGAATPTALNGVPSGLVQMAPGLGANAVRSGFITNTRRPALVIGLSIDVVNGLQLNASTGFTSTTTGWDAGGGNLARSEYRRVQTIGSQQATFTALSNDNFITMAAVYAEADPPTLATVTQTNSGPKPFEASRIDRETKQTLQVGTFESAALAMEAINNQLSRVLRWEQDVRFDGVVSFTGR